MKLDSYKELLSLGMGTNADCRGSVQVPLRKDGQARKVWLGFWYANADTSYFVVSGRLFVEWISDTAEVLQSVEFVPFPQDAEFMPSRRTAKLVLPVTAQTSDFSLAPFIPSVTQATPGSVFVSWEDSSPTEVFEVRPWPSVPPAKAAFVRLSWDLHFEGSMTVTNMPLRAVVVSG